MKNNISVVDMTGKIVSDIVIPTEFLMSVPHKQALFDVIISENAAIRQGTHSTLTRGEVSGGGRKPYKQKHTGRARQGSIRSPQYRHGGVVFGPKPDRNYKLKINRKIFALAFKSAFSLLVSKKLVFGISDELCVSKPSTKLIVNLLKALNVDHVKTLFVTKLKDDSLQKSISNLPKVKYRT